MARQTRYLMFAAAIALSGCVLFDDIERSHPFPNDAGTVHDPCDDCLGTCIDGECFEDESPCGECADDEECVDGRCQPPNCPPDLPDCPPCDDPDCAGTVKLCIDGQEVVRPELCPCEQEGTCFCPEEFDTCLECDDPASGCECVSGSTCDDGSPCVNGRCEGGQTTVCMAENPEAMCEACQDSSQCPGDRECEETTGLCYPLECQPQPDPNYEICYFGCQIDETTCPGDRFCDGLVCRRDQCECPTDSECAQEGHCVTPGTEEPISCQSDDACAPGVCIRNICIGI